MKNIVLGVEIPVKDLNRAMKFYSQVMDVELQPMEMGPSKVAIFPTEEGVTACILVEHKEGVPGDMGALVYLNGGDDLSTLLQRVEAAGGKVLQGKHRRGEDDGCGFDATFRDTEGNRVAFHSMK